MTCACYDCEACMQQGRLVTARLACTRPRSETVGTQTLRAHVLQPQEMVAAVDMCVQRFRSLRADFGLRLRATISRPFELKPCVCTQARADSSRTGIKQKHGVFYRVLVPKTRLWRILCVLHCAEQH